MQTANKIVPCIWFNGEAESATAFYTRIFPNGRVLATSHYPKKGENPGGRPTGSVLTIEFEIHGVRFTALNGGPEFKPNPSLSFFVHADDEAHVDRTFNALAEGGKVLMELGTYPWSPRYGWVQDKYGVTWQVMKSDVKEEEAKIAPSIMFTGDQAGKAEEAIKLWTSILPGGKIDHISHYEPQSGETGVMHGRFFVMGTRLTAMDSHAPHGFQFDEGLSLQIMCKDQAELDKIWSAILSNGGTEVACGWIKDKYGFNWQVSPESMVKLITTGDEAAKERAFNAMLKMKKLDIATLEAAARGADKSASAHA